MSDVPITISLHLFQWRIQLIQELNGCRLHCRESYHAKLVHGSMCSGCCWHYETRTIRVCMHKTLVKQGVAHANPVCSDWVVSSHCCLLVIIIIIIIIMPLLCLCSVVHCISNNFSYVCCTNISICMVAWLYPICIVFLFNALFIDRIAEADRWDKCGAWAWPDQLFLKWSVRVCRALHYPRPHTATW